MEAPKDRNEFFEQLLDLFSKHMEARDICEECEIKEEILNYIETNKEKCNLLPLTLN